VRNGDSVMVLGPCRKQYALAPFDTSWIGMIGVVTDHGGVSGYVYASLMASGYPGEVLFDARELCVFECDDVGTPHVRG
jgi:hypothetical protein